jgi:uncharacterized protein YegL
MAGQFDPSQFTVSKAKPLPVVLLLDTSGSMYGTKIGSLNEAVRKMLGTFTKEESQASEFLVSVITFGGSAALAHAPVPASELAYAELYADGLTPLGAALDIAKALIEDREQTPGRAYRPLIVLVSDGVPTDEDWEAKLNRFVSDGRSAKCDRMALGIGREAYDGPGRATLERFIAGTGHQVFEARQASEIHSFFSFVTMSVVSRSLSKDPNEVPKDSDVRPPEPEAPPPAQPAAPAADDEEDFW